MISECFFCFACCLRGGRRGEGRGWRLADCESSIPVYLEHKANLALLKTLPKNIEWSMLCPATMVPAPSTTTSSTTTSLVSQANTLPLWQNHWLEYIPIIGKRLLLAARVANYEITLEEAAAFIAGDLGLEGQESKWVGKCVGVGERGKLT